MKFRVGAFLFTAFVINGLAEGQSAPPYSTIPVPGPKGWITPAANKVDIVELAGASNPTGLNTMAFLFRENNDQIYFDIPVVPNRKVPSNFLGSKFVSYLATYRTQSSNAELLAQLTFSLGGFPVYNLYYPILITPTGEWLIQRVGARDESTPTYDSVRLTLKYNTNASASTYLITLNPATSTYSGWFARFAPASYYTGGDSPFMLERYLESPTADSLELFQKEGSVEGELFFDSGSNQR